MSHTVSIQEAYNLVEDPNVILWYGDSQVIGIELSSGGTLAILELADSTEVEAFSGEKLDVTEQSAWDGSYDDVQ